MPPLSSPMPLPADADLPSPVPPRGRGWSEAWVFDAVAADGSVAVAVGVGRQGGTGRGWYWAVVTGVGRTTVTVLDDDLALPGTGPPLEFRAPGLWADHNPTAAGGHWSVACEAFGVALDDPYAAWGRAFGDPTPVGLDLEWDPVGDPVVLDGHPTGASGWWSVGCVVHGEVLLGHERVELDARGTRARWWGDHPFPGRGEAEVAGWSPSGWSHRRAPAPADDEPTPTHLGEWLGDTAICGWAPVLEGADGGDGRLAMVALVGGGTPEGITGWARWRPESLALS